MKRRVSCWCCIPVLGVASIASSTLVVLVLVLRKLRVGDFGAMAMLYEVVFLYWHQLVIPYFPASLPPAPCRYTVSCTGS